VYESLEERERAIEQYRKVLELQPDHRGAQTRLQELTGGT
jgi:predicted TPR repeat methyltransferase